MAEVKIPKAGLWKVTATEYERGWGQRPWSTSYWDNEQEAKDEVKRINSENTASEAPDWYVQASYSRV